MAIDVLWTTAFLDLAEDRFDRGVEFWCDATSSSLSEPRGDTGEFATLLPPSGDAYVRVQRTADGSSGIHIDLHVPDVVSARDEAVRLGADIVADLGYVILRSPGGFGFCLVRHHGEVAVPRPVGPAPNRLDQVSIDIPPALFERECEFWAALTGWELVVSPLPEFCSLRQPPEQPLRFLLQRLDDASDHAGVTAHLDIACGDNIDAVAAHHESLGATRIGMTKRWMQMRDPVGLSYCLTPR